MFCILTRLGSDEVHDIEVTCYSRSPTLKEHNIFCLMFFFSFCLHIRGLSGQSVPVGMLDLRVPWWVALNIVCLILHCNVDMWLLITRYGISVLTKRLYRHGLVTTHTDKHRRPAASQRHLLDVVDHNETVVTTLRHMIFYLASLTVANTKTKQDPSTNHL